MDTSKKKKLTGWKQIFVLFDLIYIWFFTSQRASYKWFLHVYYNSCEIERVLDQISGGAARVRAIEYSLIHSKRADLRYLPYCPVEAIKSAVDLIIKVKAIPKVRLPRVQPPLCSALSQLMGYNQLIREVEWGRSEKFDTTVELHELKLFEFWALLRPDCEVVDRISKRWQEIGFQGNDPATDFRGMGILGLDQLIFLCSSRPEQTKHIYSLSLHPKIGFPFAVAGISMTALTRELLKEGTLKSHMFNMVKERPTIDHFHQAYCALFTLFSNVWVNSKPDSVLEFNTVRERFKEDIRKLLSDDTATLPDDTILYDL